jgi:uncharacterized membrane protein/Mg-chelatase subunit ChlD
VPFTFASPRFLLLLVAIPLAVWIGRRTLAGLDPIRRRLSMTLRLSGIVLLALALAEVQWKDISEDVQVIFLLDQSLSIPKEKQELALQVVNAARKTMDPRRDKGKLFVFGKDAFPEATLDKDVEISRTSSDISRDHTNLEHALKMALESFEGQNARRRIVLISDGNETMGDAKAAVARAKMTKTRIDVVPLEYAYENEILLDKVVLPSEAKIGEPFKVRAVVQAFRPTRAKIHLYQEGVHIDAREVELQPGANVEVFDLILKKAGFFRISAVVEALDSKDDQLFQNNEGNGFVFVKGESSVLYVHRTGDETAVSRALIDALQSEKLLVTLCPAPQFPQQASGLQIYDAVILDDVPRDAFSTAQMEAIEFAVANEGIGLVMLGGEHSFGAGDWRDTPVEKALPVEMDIKQETTVPDGALCMVMHSCEFPDGNRWGIQVCQASIDTLSSKDQAGLIQFGMGGVEWVFKMQPCTNKAKLKQLAGTMEPGDMPDFDAVFVQALDGLKRTRAAVKHMILLSDGDPSPPTPEILQAYKDNMITCSTVIICPHGGKNGHEHQLMERIAKTLGGKCYFVDNPKELPKIFQRETQQVARSLIVNAQFTPRRQAQSEILKGLGALPPLYGHVLTEPKPRADIALVSHQNAPILAHWQYGAGKSLAFTSDVTARWGADWVRWPGYSNFWAQAIRWVSKDVQESPFQVTTKVEGERGKVVLDAVDERGEFVDGLDVDGVVKSPKEEQFQVKLRQVGPGRYEADFPSKEVGTYTVSVLTRSKDGRRRPSFTTGLVFPYSEEFKKLRTDRALLAAIARAGDGKVVDPHDAIELKNGFRGFFSRDDKTDDDAALKDKWSLLLAIAVGVFLADVAVRRVAIDWGKVWARASAPFRRGPSRAPERVATMDRLLHRKQDVRTVVDDGAPAPPIVVPPVARKFDAGSAAPAAEPVVIAGRGPATTPPTSPAGAVPTPPPQERDAPGGMNRLLEAKRRAMRGKDSGADGETKA